MKADWKMMRLGDVCHVYQPETLSQKQLKDGPYPVYGANGQIGVHSDYNHENPELTLGCRGTCGSVNWTHGKTWINGNAMVVKPDVTLVDPHYLTYALKGGINIQDAISGTAQPQITRKSLSPLEIPLPPLAEQKRIVALLDEAFAGIDAAKAKAEENIENANVLFKSHVQAIFNQGTNGWRNTTLEEISTNLDSKRVPITKNIRASGEFPYYGASGIVDYVESYIFEGDNLLVSEDGANLLARSTPIAFSVTGKYWVNNHAHILHFENMATQRFVEFYLESIKLDGYITGAAQPKLTQKALNSIPIPIPDSIEEQGLIVRSLESLQQETEVLSRIYKQKLAALKELESTLLSEAFAGELTA